MKKWMFLGLLLATGIAIGASCSATDEAILAGLGEGCLLDSDCNGELICVFRRCHIECETSADCPLGPDDERLDCRLGEPPHHVCQLGDENRCALHSDCPPTQVCGPDLRCRDECLADPDCVSQQVCAQKLCAELDELVDGQLPTVEGQSGEGRPCTVNSDCEDPLLCIGGRCLFECVTDADCRSGQCVDNYCVPPTLDAECLVPVDQEDCSDQCDPGFTGVRLCQPDLTWGDCTCLSGTGGAGGAGGGGAVSFGSPQSSTASISGVTGIQIAQLDAGTTPDIVATAGGPADLALGDGTGDFDWLNSTTSPAPVSEFFAVGEVSGDTSVDVIGYSNTQVRIFPGDGNGGVGSPNDVTVTTINPFIQHVQVADLDGDTDLDILCVQRTLPVVQGWLRGVLHLGGGSYSVTPPISVNGVPVAGAVGDFNGDSDPDVAAALSNGFVEYQHGDGSGTSFSFGGFFSAGTANTIPEDGNGLRAADLNGDGRDDLVVLVDQGSTGEAVVFISQMSGGFATGVPYTVIDEPSGLLLADLNGDGFPEIVAGGDAAGSSLTVWTNAGDGTFVDAQTLSAPAAKLRRAIATDLDGDSIMDLVSWQDAGDFVYIFLGL